MNANDDKALAAEVDSRLDDLFGDDDEAADDDVKDAESPVELEEETEAAPVAEADAGEPAAEPRIGMDLPPGDPNAEQISELKSVILSLEWEITDAVMQKLGDEVEKLEKARRDDKIVVAFLQLLASLGKYIRKKKASSHPDAIRLLHSVYENLEKVMLSPEITEQIKKRMLVGEVNKYKVLKEQILTKPAPPRREEKAPKPGVSEAEAEFEEEAESDDDDYMDEDLGPGPAPEPRPRLAGPDGGPQQAGLAPADVKALIQALGEINETIKKEFTALREELKIWRENR